MPRKSSKPTYAFIDASNLFYGGVKSLGWKIDYKKLIAYIKKQYSPLEEKPIKLKNLVSYLRHKIKDKKVTKTQIASLMGNIQRVKFYLKLDEFGYILKLKPVKIFREEGGRVTKKANCDVDMTFDLMRNFDEYSGVLVLSGDGDFAVVLKYLRDQSKTVKILARGERTAKEIRQLAGGDFRDFNYLREILRFEK